MRVVLLIPATPCTTPCPISPPVLIPIPTMLIIVFRGRKIDADYFSEGKECFLKDLFGD
jgi:hypothetical protein